MSDKNEDPVLGHARREALCVLLVWCGAAAYTITYSTRYGYGGTAESLRFILGIPDWVVWGIIAPWTVCLIIGMWFSFVFIRDDDLGGDDGTRKPDGLAEHNDA